MSELEEQSKRVLAVLRLYRKTLVEYGEPELALQCADLSDAIRDVLDNPTPAIQSPARPPIQASGGWVRSDGATFKPPKVEGEEADGDGDPEEDSTS